ncbi:hypothetical protein RR46_02493 [Papilio xuthus]|uniref:Uncharacterized protein n=1 Tax=Papilio xuthus TaxID=66420 RepID=A0A194QMT6_PAPXU|nr:hypothetical protein RR46_02493 [Papilio xuthus]
MRSARAWERRRGATDAAPGPGPHGYRATSCELCAAVLPSAFGRRSNPNQASPVRGRRRQSPHVCTTSPAALPRRARYLSLLTFGFVSTRPLAISEEATMVRRWRSGASQAPLSALFGTLLCLAVAAQLDLETERQQPNRSPGNDTELVVTAVLPGGSAAGAALAALAAAALRQALIKWCWQREQRARPSAAELAARLSGSPRLLTPCLDVPLDALPLPLADEPPWRAPPDRAAARWLSWAAPPASAAAADPADPASAHTDTTYLSAEPRDTDRFLPPPSHSNLF